VFVLPGTSGANRRKDYDGRPNRIAWWRDLAALAGPELAAR
jgi:TDG/mug DNA glycosylase family protein